VSGAPTTYYHHPEPATTGKWKKYQLTRLGQIIGKKLMARQGAARTKNTDGGVKKGVFKGGKKNPQAGGSARSRSNH